MHDLGSLRQHGGGREALLLAGVAAVPAVIGLIVAPDASVAASAALAARGLAGIFFLLAALLLYLDWRVRPALGRAWLLTAVMLLACQLLGSAALALGAEDGARRQLGWPLVVDLVVTGVVVALAALALEERPPRLPHPLVTGLALGTAGTVAKPLIHLLEADLRVASTALVAGVGIANVALAAVVLRRHSLPHWLARRLAVTLVLVSAAHVAASPRFPSTVLDLTSSAVLLLAGVLWASTSFVLLRASLEAAGRGSAHLESFLLEIEGTERDVR